jgi:hypothetical protein
MVDFEQTMKGAPKKRGPVTGFAHQATEVVGDAVELAELQARLAKADAALAAAQAKPSIAVLVIGSCLALSSLPVLALGLASLLAATTVLNVWQSQLLVGVTATLIAAVMVYLAIRGVINAVSKFQRSAEQFANNLAWFKATVRPSSTTATRQ